MKDEGMAIIQSLKGKTGKYKAESSEAKKPYLISLVYQDPYHFHGMAALCNAFLIAVKLHYWTLLDSFFLSDTTTTS